MINKYFLYKYIVIKITFIVCLSLENIAVAEQVTAKIRIASGEWEPFYSESLPHYGLDSQVVSESFALVGVEVEYGFFPWPRSFKYSEDNVWDATIGWPISESGLATHYYSDEPINKGEWVLFHRVDNPIEWENISDLKGKVFGILTEDWVLAGDSEFVKAIEAGELKVDKTYSEPTNLLMLFGRRIDAFPSQKLVGLSLMKRTLSEEMQKQITFNPKVIRSMPLYLLLNKTNPKNKKLMALFNEGYALLKSSGRYQQIMANFHRK